MLRAASFGTLFLLFACASRPAGSIAITQRVSYQGAVTSPLASCIGHWTGRAHNDGDWWTIDMNVINANTRLCGTIEYPSLACGGVLSLCASMANGEATFEEAYSHNPGTCAPAGQIRATCQGRSMHWEWFGEGGPVSTTLTR